MELYNILTYLGSYLASCLFSVPQIVPQQCPTWFRAGASKAFACLGELRRSVLFFIPGSLGLVARPCPQYGCQSCLSESSQISTESDGVTMRCFDAIPVGHLGNCHL